MSQLRQWVRQAALSLLIGAAFATLVDDGAVSPPASAADAGKKKEAPAGQPAAGEAEGPPVAPELKGGTLAEHYCAAIRDMAAEARYAYQTRELDDLRKSIAAEIDALDARIVELKTWTERREAFAAKALAQVVGIYAAMRPEAASGQLQHMDEATAAAIISKLDARAASAILNEMPPEKAAQLATILSAASRKSDAGPKT